MTNTPTIGSITFSEKLPDNWRALYMAHKEDAARYHKALMEIFYHLENPKTDEMDKLVLIEMAVNEALEDKS